MWNGSGVLGLGLGLVNDFLCAFDVHDVTFVSELPFLCLSHAGQQKEGAEADILSLPVLLLDIKLY